VSKRSSSALLCELAEVFASFAVKVFCPSKKDLNRKDAMLLQHLQGFDIPMELWRGRLC
jgi:hypothetical protein